MNNITLYEIWGATKKTIEKLNTDEKLDCAICMKSMGQCVELVKCGHMFHHLCIKKLFCIYQDDKCPMCREHFAYQPSTKTKPMKKLRTHMIKYIANDNGFMARQTLGDMAYFFKRHKVSIEFLNKIMNYLGRCENYDFDYFCINFSRFNKFSSSPI